MIEGCGHVGSPQGPRVIVGNDIRPPSTASGWGRLLFVVHGHGLGSAADLVGCGSGDHGGTVDGILELNAGRTLGLSGQIG